jgi:large subunit ribosomal protein L9
VADALVAKGFTIDRRKIQLDDPIKSLGEFKVPVKLHKDVTAEITVVVAKEE